MATPLINREKGMKKVKHLSKESKMNWFGENSSDNTSPEVSVERKLKTNKVKCLQCGAILHSKFRHDFVQCNCPNRAFADGGLSYLRRGAVDMNKIVDMSEYEEEE